MAEPILSRMIAGRVVEWSEEDHDAAMSQGWYLDHETGQIAADPDVANPPDDAAALALVRDAAACGDERAIRAMVLENLAAAEAWADRLPGEPDDQPSRVVRAAQAFLDAFGGDVPEWVREEATALREAINAEGASHA